jgi:hypothetical protein
MLFFKGPQAKAPALEWVEVEVVGYHEFDRLKVYYRNSIIETIESLAAEGREGAVEITPIEIIVAAVEAVSESSKVAIRKSVVEFLMSDEIKLATEEDITRAKAEGLTILPDHPTE